jgi:hypothetical protein
MNTLHRRRSIRYHNRPQNANAGRSTLIFANADRDDAGRSLKAEQREREELGVDLETVCDLIDEER